MWVWVWVWVWVWEGDYHGEWTVVVVVVETVQTERPPPRRSLSVAVPETLAGGCADRTCALGLLPADAAQGGRRGRRTGSQRVPGHPPTKRHRAAPEVK